MRLATLLLSIALTCVAGCLTKAPEAATKASVVELEQGISAGRETCRDACDLADESSSIEHDGLPDGDHDLGEAERRRLRVEWGKPQVKKDRLDV